MPKIIKYSVIVVVLLLLGVISYFGFASKDVSDTLKIGVIAPLTGLPGNLGENYVNGVNLALEDYKKANPESKIEIIVEDDGYDSKKGISAYNKLVSIDNVDAILNLSSPTVDAVHEQVNKWEKPFIQLGEEAEHKDDNILEIFPGQKAALIAVGEQAKKDGYKKVSIVTQQIAAYERFIDGFQEGFDGEVSITRINPAETDMKTFALKVSAEKSDAIAIFMGAPATATFLKALNQQSIEIPQLYFDVGLQFGLEDLRVALGNLELLEGSKGAFIISETRDDFKESYKAKYGVESGMLSDYGYDAFMFLMSGHNKESKTWIKNLKGHSYSGVSGDIKLDEFGDRLPEFKIVTLVNGELK